MWEDVNTIILSDSGEFISFINILCEIGKPIIFDGDLWCSNSGIKKLPDNLTVKGSLRCTDNKLRALPKGLVVTGYIECSCNKLTSIPDGLKVNGQLFCYYNNITKKIISVDEINISMDNEQRDIYQRVIKIQKIVDKINTNKKINSYG